MSDESGSGVAPGGGPDPGRGVPALVLAPTLVLLALGSSVGCLLCAAWLTSYAGPVPLPLTVLAAAVWGLFLARTARRWSPRASVAAFPAAVWVLTLVAMDLGPGGDMPVPIGLRGLALLVAGGILPLSVLALDAGRPGEAHRG